VVGPSTCCTSVGTALKLAKREQIEFYVGVDLSSAAGDHFIGISHSFSFHALRR
jgi:hypothetical protein